MATETVRTTREPVRESVQVEVGPPVKMSWGAIFAGAVTSLALWALLYSFGLALGLSTMDPGDPGSARASGIFTGIWSLLSPLIALFVGGMVAGRGAGVTTRLGGALHGLVMWGLTTLAGAWLIANFLSSVVGGVASVGKTAFQAGAGMVTGGAGQAGDLAQTFGLDAEDALGPVNERLRAEGKPPVTSAQLQEAARDVVQEGLRQGRFDRELLVSNLAQNTALSQADAEEIAGRVEAQVTEARERVRERISSAAETVQAGALRAADVTGKAFWGVFGALFLGMVSALLGATAGVSRRQRAWARRTVVTAGTTPVEREVYP